MKKLFTFFMSTALFGMVFGQCHYVIDMQDSYGDGWNGASVDVSVNGTVLANWGLSSGSAGSDSLSTFAGDAIEFTFNSGSWDGEVTFTITDPSGTSLGSFGPGPATGMFLSHTSNSTCTAPSNVDITFVVDMNTVTSAFTTAQVAGDWNSWSAPSNLSDTDGDGVWEGVVTIAAGSTIEYKFLADNWNIQEMNDPNAACTNGNATYTNRLYTAGTGDATLPGVCWGSCSPCPVVSDLSITAVWDLTVPAAGNSGKAIMFTANNSVADLSIYGFGTAQNGGGTDGQEYTFPAVGASAGQHIIVCRDSAAFSAYYLGCFEQWPGAAHPNLIFEDLMEPSGNGDDAYELFINGTVAETFGDINTDGTGQPWEYMDSWAWKDTAAANVGNWVYGAVNCSDNSYNNHVDIDGSSCSFPLCGAPTCTAVAGTGWSEDFSGGGLPSCWSGGGGELWKFQSSGPNHVGNLGALTGSTTSGGNYAVVDASSFTDSSWIISPVIDVSALTGPTLSFFLISNEEGTGYSSTLTVKGSDDGGTTWSSLASYTGNTGGWAQKFIDISAYTATVQFMFQFSEPSTSSAFYDDIAIDDIAISAISCFDPSGLTASNVSDVSADLSWTPGGSEPAWELTYGLQGFSTGSGTLVPMLTASSHTLSGLTANTAYDYYVKADCGFGTGTTDLSNWAGPYTFTTLLAAGTCGYFTVELIDTYGDGWNGNYVVVMINGTATDTLTVASGAGPETTVIAVNIGDNVDIDYVNAGSWCGENVINVYDHTNVLIGASAGTASGCPTSIMGLTACPSCSQPSALNASNLTNSSADLDWTAGGSETAWSLAYGATGFALGTGTFISITSNPYSLTGLTAATAYDYYLQADCGTDTSAWSGPYTFATTCNDDVAPYFEDFDVSIPVCWSQESADVFDWTLNTGGTTSASTGPSDDMTGGGNYIYIETSSPRAPGDSAIIYSSNIDLSTVSSAELRFFTHMYGGSIGTVNVDISNDNGATWANIFTKTGDQGNQWNEETVSLANHTGVVSFRITGWVSADANGVQYWGDIAVDNFQVREPSLNDIAVLSVSSSASTGCDLTAAETISVEITNKAVNAQTNFDISYAINAGTAVTESYTNTINAGDTATYTFTQTADLSADGVYAIDVTSLLTTDQDNSNDMGSLTVENEATPADATAMGDTICNGDTATVSATAAAGSISWWDASTGGNSVGSGSSIMVAPTTTTSYYAEVTSGSSYMENFDSYNNGDLIAQVSNDWQTWSSPTGGGADDADVSNAYSVSAPNSLHISNANGDDIVFPFNGLYSSGTFKLEFNLLFTTDAYFNLQGDTVIGNAWAFDVFVDSVNGLTVAGLAAPVSANTWMHVQFIGNLNSGDWEVMIDGVSAGTFNAPSPVASANFYGNTGNDYYLDNVSYSSPATPCASSARAEAVVTVEDCSNILELANGNLDIYPNPNNGQFVIANSDLISNVTITDVQGKIVYTVNNVNLNKVNVDVTDLEKGMYMINVKTINGTITESVIVQ